MQGLKFFDTVPESWHGAGATLNFKIDNYDDALSK